MAGPFGEHDLAEFRERMDELRATLPVLPGSSFRAYTDGACLGNPGGVGGWAAILNSTATVLFGHLSSTTNNRAEALAILSAFEWIPAGSSLALFSDSELSVNILAGRYKVRANTDIWDVITHTRADKQLQVNPQWVRGHAGDPMNELADHYSKLGATNGQDVDRVSAVIAHKAPPPELDGLEPRNDWEREFLASVATQLRAGRALSEKQQAVIERIRARAKTA